MSYILNYSKADQHFLGTFVDSAALTSAYPTGVSGDFAILQSTDTIWLWDAGTNTWVDTGVTSTTDDVFGIDTGAANVVVVNSTKPIQTLTAGDTVSFVLTNTITSTTPTLNVDGTGAIQIKKSPTDSVFPYDMMAGKIYNCVYNTTGTPFWQILNPESAMITYSYGFPINARVPSQFATVADAYAYYLRVASSGNIGGQAAFQILFDAPGIYDVSTTLSAAPSVPLVLSTTGTAIPSGVIGTHVNGIVAGVGSSTVELASPPPASAVVGGAIYLARGWTNNQNHGNYEITNITGNVITFATPRGDCVTEAGGGSSKYVQFFPTVVRSAGTLGAMFIANSDCRIDSYGIAYRGRSALYDMSDTFASVALGGRFNFSGLVNCYAVGISASIGSQVRQTSLASFYGCYSFGISLSSGASYISQIAAISSNESNFTKLVYCGKAGAGNPAVLIGSSSFFYNTKPIIYTEDDFGVVAQQRSQAYINISERIKAASIEMLATNGSLIHIDISTASNRFWSDLGGKITTATGQGTANIPFNATQQDGSFVGNAEDGGKVIPLTGSTNLTLGSQIVAVDSASPTSIVLPALTADVTVRYTIKNVGAGAVTLTAADAKTIDGSASQVILQWQSIDVHALGGTQWIIT